MRVSTKGIRALLSLALCGFVLTSSAAGAADPTPKTTPAELTPEEEALLKELVLLTTAEPQDGSAPLTVKFSTESSYETPVNPKYVWNFADGSKPVRGQQVTHTFKKPGEYKVTVNATADGGMAGSDWIIITVEQPEKKKD